MLVDFVGRFERDHVLEEASVVEHTKGGFVHRSLSEADSKWCPASSNS